MIMINSRFLILLLIPILTFSQRLVIKDLQTKYPLKGVNIYSANHGTTTDTNGVCNLQGFLMKDEITISHIGYLAINITKNESPDILYLRATNVPIKGVNVISFKSNKERKRYNKLERDVIRVYPYAVLVGSLLQEYSAVMDSIFELSFFKRRKEKKKVFTAIEKQLITTHGKQVRRLTKNQGRIFIKLVDRETDFTSHQIIKDFRGFFIAGFWQLTARLFGHNLKSNYNPEFGEDKLIEHILNSRIGI
ncbi:uncharacterized protein METZ01_LOCUS73724 [marine metagenome]|jgi:hypothetical protein|uniref:DUF4294 domain-containing protein n=1 Tax=marine metagenome TaxID=408172 RepID=A0A381TXZ3_9ZZZZ